PASADQEVQVALADRERGGGEDSGRPVPAVEAVRQLGTFESRDASLPGQVAGCRTVTERGTRGRPGRVGGAFEVLQHSAARWRVGAGVIRCERRPVEVSGEVLRARTARDPAG